MSFDKFKASFYRVTASFGRRFLGSFWLASFEECWRVFGEFLASFGEFVCFFCNFGEFRGVLASFVKSLVSFGKL